MRHWLELQSSMEIRGRRFFTPEFKRDVVRMIDDSGKIVTTGE